MLSLNQRLSQQQKLSPQQIQYQKLLQLNSLTLEQRIKTELELNPILEELADGEMELTNEQLDSEIPDIQDVVDDDAEEISSVEEEFDVEDFMNDYDEGDYSDDYSRSSEEEKTHPVAPAKESLSEHLLQQLSMLDLSDDLMMLGEEIIGNLDAGGYLKRDLKNLVDELRMFEHLEISDDRAELLLKQIQTFDPVGIASRNLQECLLVQIQNSSFDPYYSYLAEELILKYFDEFTKKRFDLIRQKMNLSDETLKSVADLIQRLNPKPGEGNLQSMEANQITPDFIIEKVDDDFVITLNDKGQSSVTVNKAYLEMLSSNKRKRKISPREKDAYKFLREKFESAKWFIACIQQRRETLLKIMRAILEKQYEFFDKGAKFLRPMIYKDIAEEIQMDISTISRVVNGKYVQSPMGIHELKYFFSEGLATDSGEEVSNKHIKERIKEIIIGESKKEPFSDDRIAEIINEEGIHIARRTVAKYRESLKIPVARLRREL